MRYPVTVVLASAVLLGGAASWLEAKATDIKKAQALGFADIKKCADCHKSPKGGKELNARGQFLVDKKAETKAKEIDLNWLKDYKEAK